MSRTLSCPNATQEKSTDQIKCKVEGICRYQWRCPIDYHWSLTYGAGICLSRNKIPPLPEKKIYPKSFSRKKRRQLEEKEKRKNN